jgi:phosphoglycerol transferase MdoB-like AlkP superfamily enzyme
MEKRFEVEKAIGYTNTPIIRVIDRANFNVFEFDAAKTNINKVSKQIARTINDIPQNKKASHQEIKKSIVDQLRPQK